MHNYIEQIIMDTYTDSKESLKSENFIYGYLTELKFYKILDFNDREVLKTINYVLDNLKLLSEVNKKSFEIILEQMGLYAYKENGELIKENYIRNGTYNSLKFQKMTLTSEQYLLHSKLLEFILSPRKTFFVSAPTSFGKTFLIIETIKTKFNKILINVPTKSLINEYCSLFKESRICTNPHLYTADKYDIFIGTPERILLLNDFSFDIAITDEGYNVQEFKDRDFLFILSQKQIQCKNIVLLPNLNVQSVINNYLEADIDIDPYVTLQFSDLDSPVTYNNYYLHITGKKAILKYKDKIINIDDLCADKKTAFAQIFNKIYENRPEFIQNSIIFFPTKNVSKFINAVNLDCNTSLINNKVYKILKKYISTNIHPQSELIDFIQKGIGVHNSNLDDFMRKCMEYMFKSQIIKCMVATSTISKGVNLPCKNIFFVTQRFSESVIDGKNTIGRAGRFKMFNNGNRIYVNLNKYAKESDKIQRIKKSSLIEMDPIKIKIENSQKKLIENDKQFSKSFKAKNHINSGKRNDTEVYDYFTGYDIKHAVIDSIKKFGENKIRGFFREVSMYDSLVEILSEVEGKLKENNKSSRLFPRFSVMQHAYVYNHIKMQKSVYSYILLSKNNEKIRVNLKNQRITFDEKKGIKFQSDNKNHINIYINFVMEMFQEIEFETQKILMLFIKYSERKYNISYSGDKLDSFLNTNRSELVAQLNSLGITYDFVQEELLRHVDEDVQFETYKDVIVFLEEKFDEESEMTFIIKNLC